MVQRKIRQAMEKKAIVTFALTVLYKCSTTHHEETRLLFRVGINIFSSGAQTNASDDDRNHHDSS